jgi:hypothetical protein
MSTISPKDLDLIHLKDSVESAIEHIREEAIKLFGLRPADPRASPLLGECELGDSVASCGQAERAARDGELLTRTVEEEPPGRCNEEGL